jgi:predicted site-specific integrase-resolvase
MSAATAGGRWISVRAASERLGINRHKMQRLVRAGVVEALCLPQSRPLVSAADVERLAKECRRPATAEV